MTAIAIARVNEGFGIAADGRTLWIDTETPGVTSCEDQTQKIFPIQGSGYSLAYTMTGTIMSESAAFNLRDSAALIAHDTSPSRFEDFESYGIKFGKDMCRVIEEARKAGAFVDLADGKLIAAICLVGYLESRGSNRGNSGYAQFLNHRDRIESSLKVDWLSAGNVWMAGAEKVASSFGNAQDQLLEQYRKSITANSSVTAAVEYTKSFVQAHYDMAARQLDPTGCEGIGGHIHSAKITPSGFEWVEPPMSLH